MLVSTVLTWATINAVTCDGNCHKDRHLNMIWILYFAIFAGFLVLLARIRQVTVWLAKLLNTSITWW
jgi:hypothetical protein